MNQTDLKHLSLSELQDRFEAMFSGCADKSCQGTVQKLMYELQAHQIELEMQNRELQEAQQQLEEARDRYADLYDFAPVSYITFDAKGCIQEINLTGAIVLGQERGRLIGKPFSQWLSTMGLKTFFNHLQQAQQGKEAVTEELQLRLADGRLLDVRLESIAAAQLNDDKPVYRSIIIDISARKHAENEIKDQARQMHLITDAMPLLIAYVGKDEHFHFVNKCYEDWYKLPREQIIGKKVREVMGEDVYQSCEEFIRCVMAGMPVTFELAVTCPGEGERDISTSYIPDIRVDDNKVMGYVVLIRDVTDTKKSDTENKIRLLETAHVSRVNTMGEMVAEIAHELNQPLAAISIYADTVSRMLSKDNLERLEMLAALNEIKLQAGRASQVIYRVRDFVSKKELQPAKTDINELVNAVLHLIEVEARWHGVTLNLDLNQAIPVVFVDKILIEQVILNLTRNAIEAMAAIKQDKRQLLIRTSQGKRNEIELEVEDSGPGLSVTEIEHVFQPFYTSKQQGMGMGLAISRSIIKAHHGRLWAISNEMGGTTFTFTLPDINQSGEFQQVIYNE